MGVYGPIPRTSRGGRTAASGRPRRLPDDFEAIFKRIVKDVPDPTAADAVVIEDSARWVAIAHLAFAAIIRDGVLQADTAHGDHTESRKHPALMVLRSASERLLANAHQLGGTPMSRARLPVAEETGASLADILMAEALEHASESGNDDGYRNGYAG